MTSLVVPLALVAAGVLVVVVFSNIRYRLGRHEVEVLLFGVRLRRVMLNDIRDVVDGRSLLAEHWPNTLLSAGRALTLERRTGLLRRFVITPKDRTHFRRQIEFALGWSMGVGKRREPDAPPGPAA
ncbi:MAG: hypothetical protein ACKVYV_00600 [Limisphaerales bacterium]